MPLKAIFRKEGDEWWEYPSEEICTREKCEVIPVEDRVSVHLVYMKDKDIARISGVRMKLNADDIDSGSREGVVEMNTYKTDKTKWL